MRFCDLFTSYKIGLKNIKSTIPFRKLPPYLKVFIILLVSSIISGIFLFFIKKWVSFIPIAIGILCIITFFIIDSTKRNLQVMLKEHYAPYSERRMKMVIAVLKQYKIDINDFDSIDRLIEEAKLAQVQSDYITPLKKPLKTLGAIIIPIIAYIAPKIGDVATPTEIFTIAIQVIVLILLAFSLIFPLTPIIKEILYKDYNKYEELIYDLRQITLFHSNKS